MNAVYGWKDLRSSVLGGDFPLSNSPTLAAFGPSGVLQRYAFAIDDYVELDFHVDHDYWPGSLAYPHVHWSTNGTSTATVKWELRFTYAQSHNQGNYPADTVITIEEAAQGSAWRGMTTEAGGYSLIEPDTLVHMRLKRITNGGTNNLDNVFGLHVDFHYRTLTYATPYRSPNFYTG